MLSSTPAPAVTHSRHRRQDPYGIVFWLLLLLFELFVFTLPLFPNGDGPVHLYLSSVFWKLATHSSPLYGHFYAIRHLVQPYSFHYYLLILLEHIMPVDMAEKCFVGLIWATLATGFRTLARTLAAASGHGTPAASLLIFPLLFSWPVSAGFFNFTFGCGLLLFALAYYTRLGLPGNTRSSFGALFLTLILLVLAHPVPIMVFICLGSLDLGLQLLAGWQTRRTLRLPLPQAAALGLACLAFVFPILIADKAAVAGSITHLHPNFGLLLPMLLGYHVSYFHVSNGFGRLYQFLIVCMLPVSMLLLLRAGLLLHMTTGRMNAAERLLISSLVFLAATLIFPETMNGSAEFVVRMWFVVWLTGTVCMAALAKTGTLEKWIAGFGVATAMLCLSFGLLYVRPVALQQAQLEHAPLPPNARGLFFQPLNGMSGVHTHTWWSVAFWDGVRPFVAHNDVLLNTPWLQLTIVPVQENGRAGLMRDLTPVSYSESPSYVLDEFKRHPELKASSLALADFLLMADPNSAVPDPLGFAESFLGPLASEWSCTQHDFYAICTRKPHGGR